MSEIRIVVTSQYGTLSRGRHSARLGGGSNVQWAGKDSNGNLVIDGTGDWHLHCADGFRRTARAVISVSDDGTWAMRGDTKRFNVL